MMNELMNYMGYLWVAVDGDIVTIGINDDGLDEFAEIEGVELPVEGTVVDPDEVCGELDTDQGPLNLYCPVDGKVVEVNEAVNNNPSLIIDDNTGDGWLFRVEAENIDQLDPSKWSEDED